jgi:hypothetical protein
MIRRQIVLPDSDPTWLLISQVDHAHISGEIARNWQESLTLDVVEAIRHHDDGWSSWEADPKLDPGVGAPYSFLEMPLPESLQIWDESIATARKFGPLAGYIVAGHFYSLLNDSDNAGEPMAVAWLTAKRKVRTAWLDEWIRGDKSHTLEYAKRAQQMLLLTDLFSLWLCCESPVAGESVPILDQSVMKPRADSLLDQFKLTSAGFGRRNPTPDNPQEALAWIVAVDPYPFSLPSLSLSSPAVAAPSAKYGSWRELTAASHTIDLRWRLIPPGEPQSPAG